MSAGSGYSRVAHALEIIGRRVPTIGEANVAPIGPDRNLNEARLLLDHKETAHLLVALPDFRDRFAPPLGSVLPATWFESRVGDELVTYLDIASSDPDLTPTFLSLVGEMLDRVDESGEACIDELMKVLFLWREALSREQKQFSRQRVIGLFGELTILQRLASGGIARAMTAWRGQDGYRHDFFLTNALEVKAYTGLNSPSVGIHGAYQLDPPVGGALHLVAFRLEESASGATIADLLDRLQRDGVPIGQVLQRSTDQSPVWAEDSLRFVIGEERLFHVSEGFPGLRASRLGEQALLGLSQLKYDLLLDACPGRLDSSRLPDILDGL